MIFYKNEKETDELLARPAAPAAPNNEARGFEPGRAVVEGCRSESPEAGGLWLRSTLPAWPTEGSPFSPSLA